MKKYNKKKADKLAEEFEKLTQVDLLSISRETYQMTLRCLFYKILKDLNYMNDKQMSDWFEKRGVKRNRSSIFSALKKVDLYYLNFKYFQDFYCHYFNDKVKHVEEDILDDSNKLKEDTNDNIQEYEKDALDKLINDIRGDRREEILNLVSLRIKSWEWKNKDKCEIIEGVF